MSLPSWTVGCFAVESIFLLFHASVAIVVVAHVVPKSLKRLYATSFSVLYLLQSVADWGSYTFVSRSPIRHKH